MMAETPHFSPSFSGDVPTFPRDPGKKSPCRFQATF